MPISIPPMEPGLAHRGLEGLGSLHQPGGSQRRARQSRVLHPQHRGSPGTRHLDDAHPGLRHRGIRHALQMAEASRPANGHLSLRDPVSGYPRPPLKIDPTPSLKARRTVVFYNLWPPVMAAVRAPSVGHRIKLDAVTPVPGPTPVGSARRSSHGRAAPLFRGCGVLRRKSSASAEIKSCDGAKA